MKNKFKLARNKKRRQVALTRLGNFQSKNRTKISLLIGKF